MTAPNTLAPGLWVVLATPFDDDLAIDHASLAKQVQLAVRSRATGVVALGVFGEAASMSLAEQAAVVRTVTSETDLPVVAGIAARATAPAREQADSILAASRTPPTALMVQIGSPSAEAIASTLHTLYDATDVPAVLQDYPVASGVQVSTDVVVQVLDSCPFVAAVKAESAPTSRSIAQLVTVRQVPVYGGLGGVGLIDELASGAAGAMTGFSHPEALRAALDAHERDGFSGVLAAWAPWLPLANFEGQAGIGLALRKQILQRRGILTCAAVRPPAPRMPAELMPHLDRHLEHLPPLTEVST